MATIESTTYSKIPLFSDAGNLTVARLRHSQSAAVANGTVLKLGKLPPYAEPLFISVQVSGLGGASLDVFIDTTEVKSDVTAAGFYPISGVSPSETGERDIEVHVDTADTGTDFDLILDIGYFNVLL